VRKIAVWKHKKCICKICDKNGGSFLFNSIHEGKTHLFMTHKIPYNRSREHLKVVKKVEQDIKKMWEV